MTFQEVRSSGCALGEGCLWVALVLEEAPDVGLALKLKHLDLKKQDCGPGGCRVQVTGLQNTPRCPRQREKTVLLTSWLVLGQSLTFLGLSFLSY